MKRSLYIVAFDYENVKSIAAKVASFFSMRLFDIVEMFEFDHSPRKIDEVILNFGSDYVEKEICSTIKMSLDFDDVTISTDLRFLNSWKSLFKKIQEKCLVIFLNDKKQTEVDDEFRNFKLEFLTNCCDLAIGVNDLPESEICDKIISEIKEFYKLEV